MRTLYQTVSATLDKIDFGAIWLGFQRYHFALYDETNVYLGEYTFPRDNRFLGNTAIDYEGDVIAIWNISDPTQEDPQLLASNIVHEMFHVYQKKHNEKRYPNDLVMLDYPTAIENYQLKYHENSLLANAYLEKSDFSRRKLLEEFVASRKCREKMIGHIIHQEFLTETIEGLAEFAGCMALKQLSSKKFDERILDYISKLSLLDERIFDIRRNLYFSGALFFLLLSELKIEFHHCLNDTSIAIFPWLANMLSTDFPVVYPENNVLAELYAEHIDSRKKQFKDFLDAYEDAVSMKTFICGYDPMNMIRMDNMILCSHFIMLENGAMNEPLFLKGPVLVYLKENSYNEIYSYAR